MLPSGCAKSKETMLVIGAKGELFKVPVNKDVEIESETKICLGNMLLVEEADYNLLGSDMIIALGINLIVKESQLVVSLYKLTTEDEDKIDSKVWHTQGEAGRLEIESICIDIERPEDPIRIKQYPISMEGRRGLKPVIDDLLKRGTLEPCPKEEDVRTSTIALLNFLGDKGLKVSKSKLQFTEPEDLELRTTTAQNPAQFLFGEALEEPTHNCAEVVELQTKIRPDLEEEELEEGEKWFVDGSARVVEGKRKSGYAIVDGKSGKVVESGPLSASLLRLVSYMQYYEHLRG
ncbi:hypothetical protein HGM15179_021243 [Zosterops borbonicus]|uniref:Uncharacterized protein n=1 Tax=Zosterops borbonicus TaxID=364589 RepID=A0A8K1D7P0_9PASS|nr:hypothetical protein HGM15179_021243 [Zosterops borbonicus]